MPLSLVPPHARRRRSRRRQTAAAPAVESPEAPIVDGPADEPGADGRPDRTEEAPPRHPRRSAGAKKPGEAPAAADGDATRRPSPPRPSRPRSADAAQPAKRGERKRTRDSGRARPPRRTPPRRAPLPKAKRELLVSVDAGEKRVAVLEDDVVAEVYLERPEHRSIAGNVYLGTVDNVLPGMEAAFVEIGLEKNGFLYVDEIVGPELEGRKGARKIQDLIQRGQTILVQAVKDPMKTKGARLTTEISLPGRFVVYVPHGDGLGVSRRLEDDERNRLKAIVKEIAPKQGGVIVRTAAEGASAEDVEPRPRLPPAALEDDRGAREDVEGAGADLPGGRAAAARHARPLHRRVRAPARRPRPHPQADRRLPEEDLAAHGRARRRATRSAPPLMEAFGVEQEIRSTLNRRVDLPSGGYLIFDYAEAFTVIDVNTGRFVGSRSKTLRRAGSRTRSRRTTSRR